MSCDDNGLVQKSYGAVESSPHARVIKREQYSAKCTCTRLFAACVNTMRERKGAEHCERLRKYLYAYSAHSLTYRSRVEFTLVRLRKRLVTLPLA